jgi:hypothetical protein
VLLWFAFQQWGALVTKNSQFAIDANNLQVGPPQPTWIYGNVKAEVIRDASLEELNSLDHDLVPRLIDAFEMHPWVAEVMHLYKKHPNEVIVQLAYRKPVAMVEVIEAGVRRLVPVDSKGVVLPTDGFHNQLDSAENYPRISAGRNMPPGPKGTTWGDSRIRGAAAIANLLGDDWRQLALHRITANPSSDGAGPVFVLRSRNDNSLIWGRAPGEEVVGEPQAATKLQRLATFIQHHKTIEDAPLGSVFDLREATGSETRTARQVNENR